MVTQQLRLQPRLGCMLHPKAVSHSSHCCGISTKQKSKCKHFASFVLVQLLDLTKFIVGMISDHRIHLAASRGSVPVTSHVFSGENSIERIPQPSLGGKLLCGLTCGF